MNLNITSLTTDQLIQLNQDVVALIKARRRQEAGNMRRQLSCLLYTSDAADE